MQSGSGQKVPCDDEGTSHFTPLPEALQENVVPEGLALRGGSCSPKAGGATAYICMLLTM